MTIETVIERSAGLDIAKASLVACVRVPKPGGGWRVSKRRFSTMTADLGALAEWLATHEVTRVGMESTSDYWRPVFYMLEDRFECWLLNARHMRAVPGRKTDMTDAEWICDLVAHGLVRPSFAPPPPIRRLRDLTRRRGILLADRSREKQRMEKLLEDAGVKLSVVASDIFSKSGRAMLDALIAGERDGQRPGRVARGRLRIKIPEPSPRRLTGRFSEHHAFLAQMIVTHIDQIGVMVAQLDARIDGELSPYRAQVELLDSINGIDTRTAQVIIAEIGVDMSRFPSAAHLASWAGVCPGNNKTAGKAKAGHTRPATAGSSPPSAPPRWAPSARRTPTTTPCSAASPRAAAVNAPKPPSRTANSSRSGTCSAPRLPTTTSAPTTSCAATIRSIAAVAPSTSSDASATRSPSNPPPDARPSAPHLFSSQVGDGPHMPMIQA